MAETKYGKFILRQSRPNPKNIPAIPVSLEGIKDWGGIQPRMTWQHIMAPVVLQEKPRTHSFDKFLCFLGSDPKDSFDFGAELEITIGSEVEKHTVNESTIICIPKGTSCGPINFKKISKPIILVEIAKGAD